MTAQPSNVKPGFWLELGEKFTTACAKYGELRAVRQGSGWVVEGHSAEGIAEYRRLAVIGAKALGFHGTEEQAVNYWLNGVDGSNRRREGLEVR